MLERIVIALACIFPICPAVADDTSTLVGIWKLTSQQVEFKDGSPPRAVYGEHPVGYLILTAQGRMMAFTEAEGRKAPKTDSEAAAAFRTMVAYTGLYTVAGAKWTTKVDAAWNPAWEGTEQVREFKLNGDRLDVVTMWQPQVNFEGKIGRAILSWERAK